MQPKIYISYSWSKEGMSITDTIDTDFQTIGLTLIRDKRNIAYKESLREFMRSMTTGDYVLLIISESYLKSKNCMYEALELFKNAAFKEKILPILAPSAGIFNALGRLQYIKYWEGKIEEINIQLKELSGMANLSSIYEELDHYTQIRASIDKFIDIISDMRTVSWPEIRDENSYEDIFAHIGYDTLDAQIFEECIRMQQIGDIEEQELAIYAAELKYKDNLYILQTKASIAKKNGKYKIAEATYRRATILYYNDWLTHYHLALFLSKILSNYVEARKHYTIALRLNPDNEGILNNLAVLLKNHTHDYNDAKALLIRAILLHPNSSLSHSNLAVLLKQRFQEYKEAKMHYQIAIKLAPEDPELYHNLAILLEECFQDYEGALKNFEKANTLPIYSWGVQGFESDINPFFSAIRKERFARFLHHRLKDYAGARGLYESALKINPDFVECLSHFANLLLIPYEEYDLACEYYERALKLDPNIQDEDVSRNNLIAALRHKLHNYEDARKHYEYLINKHPEDATLLNEFGSMLANNIGDYQAAEAHYKKALDIDINNSSIHYNYGNLLAINLKRYPEAQREYEYALRLNPEHSWAKDNLNNVLKLRKSESN